MKPWLFDILACPIDKHYPLKLIIFSYETQPEKFQSILGEYTKRDIEKIKSQEIIDFSEDKNAILIKDNIILEFTKMDDYLKKIISRIKEFNNIEDRSSNNLSMKCFELSKTKVKDKLIKFSSNLKKGGVDSIIPELYFVNQVKLEIEIETGILYCEKCKRWYPIVETIPQMLPDKYRDKDKDIEFLQNNKSLLDNDFLNSELKPYNISP